MIDVVFLLLLFFLLTARTPMAGMPITQSERSASAGAPRIITFTPDRVQLNGTEVPLAELGRHLQAQAPAESGPVALRATSGATVQRLIDVMDRLTAAGLGDFTVLE